MANSVTKLVDSTRRLVVKLDSNGAETNALKIDAGSLNYALNANGYILGTGSDRLASYGLELQKAFFSVNNAGLVTLYTNGDALFSNTILNLSYTGTFAFEEGGNAMKINCASLVANTTGNIYLTSTTAYSLVLDFRKIPFGYDQGQTADPTAFNRGPARGFGQ